MRLFLQSGDGNSGLDWLTYVIGAAILVEWKLLRRGHIPPDRVHLGALVLGGLILLRSLLTFAIASDITQVFFILALFAGRRGDAAGVARIYLHGIGGSGGVDRGGGAEVVAWRRSLCWSVILLSALAGAIVGIRRRAAKHAQIERTRLEDGGSKAGRKADGE